MNRPSSIRVGCLKSCRARSWFLPAAVMLLAPFLLAGHADAANLKVMKTGLGAGTVVSSTPGINCGSDCDEAYGSAVSVTLTATPAAGSSFVRWDGDPDADTSTSPDCAGTSPTCTFSMSSDRSVRPVFALASAIASLSDLTPEGIAAYLAVPGNAQVNTPARFVAALSLEFKQNWILMSRSESLQTGTAEFPRMLLPNANAESVFSLGVATHSSYPGSHPNAIEYMQWDATQKNFRFHEIVLDAIPAMDGDGDGVGVIPPRTRSVTIDDPKCNKCHSTRNVLNDSAFPGTTGIPVGLVQAKSKPNWDSYDSWGGMMPLNRDRIYQGSVEAAAFRRTFNPWTWRSNDAVRAIIEQLSLQPPGVSVTHAIKRISGGVNDGHVNFGFDTSPPVLTEPAPSSPGTGIEAPINTTYAFDGVAGSGAATPVTRGGSFLTLHHSSIPSSDEGRGVRFFDNLGGLAAGKLNQKRVADELVNHRFATGSVPIDVRPIAMAITKFGCLTIDTATDTVVATPALSIDLGFFNARNGMGINALVADTRARAFSLPRRKADIEKLNLNRTGDVYVTAPTNGLIPQYGATTSAGIDGSLTRLRQEVFRRPLDLGFPDRTVMSGIYVDRELESNIEKVALYRYFLEPLGVSVDKWSMGVRGRSRTYTFADVFGTYLNEFSGALVSSLTSDPAPGLSDPNDCSQLIAAVNTTLSALPLADAVPTYTDVQRIFNKSCIECHGGLDYPPYGNYGSSLDLSEDEAPPPASPPLPSPRLARSHSIALSYTTGDPATSFLYQRITATSENCPFGLMPCGGPALSKTDVETIRRWIVGARPSTAGDPHLKTVDGINYDFQSAGEHVLLRDENLEIQARQTAVATDTPLGPNGYTGLTSCVSVNSAVALRVGRHRVTYQPNLSGKPDPDGLQLRVDGELQKMGAQGIALAAGGRIIATTAPGGIQVEAPGGAVVIITPGWWNYYQLWYLNVDTRHVRATQGVMGAIAPGSWLPTLPDGSTVGPRPADLHQRYEALYDKFGKAWRVSDATSLFDYAPGTSTDNFTIASWPGESPNSCVLPKRPDGEPGKPPVKALALEVAQRYCGAVLAEDARENCVQDVRVTAEPGFAQTYLRAEHITRNRAPTAPTLIFPDRFQTAVAVPVSFSWNKTTDLDGGPIRYRYCLWSVSERFDINKCNLVSIQKAWHEGGAFYAVVVALLGLLLLALLLFTGWSRHRGLLGLTALVVVVALIVAFYLHANGSAPATLSRTETELVAGKAYYWKVIAEDNNGGTVESETRRLETK